MKIVVLDGYAANPDDLSWEPLKEFGELTVYDRTPAADLIKRAKDADMLLTNKCRLKEEELSQLPCLKYIGELATGYNNIDIEYAHSRGIVVSNIPSYSTDSVVQMTFAHIFNITNQVSHYASEVRAGRWSRNADFCYWDTPLHELAGRTLGIVGLGHIGMRVAQVAHGLGMDVEGKRPVARRCTKDNARRTDECVGHSHASLPAFARYLSPHKRRTAGHDARRLGAYQHKSRCAC